MNTTNDIVASVDALCPLSTENFSTSFCAHVKALQYDDLPPAVIESLKLFLMDTFGVIAAARDAAGIKALASRIGGWEKNGIATELIEFQGVSPPSAAMINAAAAHAVDFDDQHDPARVHSYCVMLPVLLATAQGVGKPVTGRDFLLALAVGTELHARFGLACYNSLGKGWHPTMTFGTMAGALAAGKLLGLDLDALQDALGLAFHQASGSAQSARDGALSKRMGPGFAARNAVTAAFLAADGITGTRRTLEGTAGLFSLYERNEVHPGILVEGLGEKWHLLDYSVKPYPCCRCNHTTIGLGIALNKAGIRPEDIKQVEILMGAVNHLTVGAPYQAERNSVVQAQFNASYSFAAALHDGEISLRHYQKPAITAPGPVALAQRTRVLVDSAIEATAIEPARVRVTLHSNRVVEQSATTIKGSPADPMSMADVTRKFKDCMTLAFGDADRGHALLASIRELERSDDVLRDVLRSVPKPL